jgi:hypothetical protein
LCLTAFRRLPPIASPSNSLSFVLSNTSVGSTPGVTGTDVALSADGRTLYLNMAKINAVAAFAVHGGSVT